MTSDQRSDSNLRVLVYAPIGRDRVLTTDLLTRSNIPCHVCHSLREVRDEMRAGAGAILLTEETLSDPRLDDLAAALCEQPPWADISILLFSRGDRNQAALPAPPQPQVLRN